MADLSDYPRVLALAPSVKLALDARGGDIPAWLDLGWIFVESGVDVGQATTKGFAAGELGLFQLAPDERSATGFTDTARMTSKSDVDYQIAAGHALIDYYGGKVAAVGVDSSIDPLYWMLIKLAHGMGRGGMQSLVRAYTAQAGGPPTTWDDFASFARANPYNENTDDHLSNTESVRRNGVVLAGMGNFVPPIAGGGDAAGFIPILLLVGGALWALGVFKR